MILLGSFVSKGLQFHGPDCATLPPVKIYIVKGDQEDISIKISDQGGGIARSGLPLLYTYVDSLPNYFAGVF